MQLTPEQQGLKTRITVRAIVTGIAIGLLAGLLVYWLAGNAGDFWRWVLTVLLGAGAAFLSYRVTYNSGVAKSVCGTCGTAFGIREVERREDVVGVEQKRKVAAIKSSDKTARAMNKVTTWAEEKVEITAVDECVKCHARTERKWQVTRDVDKREEDVPA